VCIFFCHTFSGYVLSFGAGLMPRRSLAEQVLYSDWYRLPLCSKLFAAFRAQIITAVLEEVPTQCLEELNKLLTSFRCWCKISKEADLLYGAVCQGPYFETDPSGEEVISIMQDLRSIHFDVMDRAYTSALLAQKAQLFRSKLTILGCDGSGKTSFAAAMQRLPDEPEDFSSLDSVSAAFCSSTQPPKMAVSSLRQAFIREQFNVIKRTFAPQIISAELDIGGIAIDDNEDDEEEVPLPVLDLFNMVSLVKNFGQVLSENAVEPASQSFVSLQKQAQKILFLMSDHCDADHRHTSGQTMLFSRNSVFTVVFNMADFVYPLPRLAALSQLQHCFSLIQHFAAGAPLFIIGTHGDHELVNEERLRSIDKRISEVMQSQFAELLPFVETFGGAGDQLIFLPVGNLHQVNSAETDTVLCGLRSRIAEAVNNGTARYLETNVPVTYIALSDRLRDLRRFGNWAHFEEVLTIAGDLNLIDASNSEEAVNRVKRALKHLHDVGVLLFFDEPLLNHIVVLKQQWLQDCMSALMKTADPTDTDICRAFTAGYAATGILSHTLLEKYLWHHEPPYIIQFLLAYGRRIDVLCPLPGRTEAETANVRCYLVPSRIGFPRPPEQRSVVPDAGGARAGAGDGANVPAFVAHEALYLRLSFDGNNGIYPPADALDRLVVSLVHAHSELYTSERVAARPVLEAQIATAEPDMSNGYTAYLLLPNLVCMFAEDDNSLPPIQIAVQQASNGGTMYFKIVPEVENSWSVEAADWDNIKTLVEVSVAATLPHIGYVLEVTSGAEPPVFESDCYSNELLGFLS
jgi:chloramphenicol 3-O-phosphotransferase